MQIRTRTAGLRRPQAAARTAFSRPKFKIHYSKFRMTKSGRSLRRTCERTFGREQRAFAGRSCGPLGPNGPPLTQDMPAAERTGLRRRGAARRPSLGAQPAKRPRERTFGTRTAGLRRRRLRPARPFQGRNSKFNIQYSKLSNSTERTWVYSRFGLQPAEDTQIRIRTAGLRCRRLRPAAPSRAQIHPSKKRTAARSVLTDRP